MKQGALRDALRILLQRHRAELDPADYGITRLSPQGRRAAGGGLTQEQVDDILGLGRGTCERLENGRYAQAPEHVLKAIGELYQLNPHEWVWLWRMTWRRDPPYPLSPECEAIPASWLRVINSMIHPVYITNHRWEVIAFNQHFPRIFPGEQVPANTMEWMLLDGDARNIILGDWANAWAPFVCPQLWAGRAAYPDDKCIADIERRVRDCPVAGPIYRDFGPIYVHPDGATRPFNHPIDGPGWMSMHVSSPKSSARFITMTMIFDAGEERPPELPPLRERYNGAPIECCASSNCC